MVYLLLAEGFEEIEALAVTDILRRAEIEVQMVSIGKKAVTGSHQITVEADAILLQIDLFAFDALVLPGGMPGTSNLQQNETVLAMIRHADETGKLIAAICAAPKILGNMGLLQGKRATAFPAYQDQLTGALVEPNAKVIEDGNIITSRGMGTALDFALTLTARLSTHSRAKQLARDIQFQWS